MPDYIDLPGTTLEGGGQLLRLASCLASLTSTPIRVTAIRGNRPGGGGLKTQHLTSLQWLARACNARVQGMGLKSKEIKFAPPQPPTSSMYPMNPWDATGGEIVIKQSTPGSVNLVFQAILPYILFAAHTPDPVRVRITGGTNVSNSPSCDYVQQVLIPMLELIGVPPITAKIHSRGWSTGGIQIGSVTYTVTPLSPPRDSPDQEDHDEQDPANPSKKQTSRPKLPPFTLADRGPIIAIHATIIAPGPLEQELTTLVTTTLASPSFQSALFHPTPSSPRAPSPSPPPSPITPTLSFEPSHHPKRIYLLLVATSTTGIKLGHDYLYDRAIRPDTNMTTVIEALVRKVTAGLLREIRHGGCVDEYMRDQLVVFQALSHGRSVVDGGSAPPPPPPPETEKSQDGEKTELRRGQTDSSSSDQQEHGKPATPAPSRPILPSLHARTAMWVAETLLGVHFDASGSCVGIGFVGVGPNDAFHPASRSPEDDDDALEDLTARVAQL